MKNIFKKSVVAAGLSAVLLSTAGCSDFLDQEVPGAVTADVFYETEEEALQATTAIYDGLTAHYNSVWASSYLLRTLLSDESNAGGSGFGDQPAYQSLDDYTFDASNDVVEGVWRITYNAIFNANRVINRVEPTTELRERLIAEAKVLRAYAYLDLVSLWGPVPIVLDNLDPGEWSSTIRNPVEEVYAQIEQDLKEAIEVLPVKSGYGPSNLFRVTQGTAQALLGKAYLYQERWAEAAAMFDLVITSGEYGLEPSVGAVFSPAGEFGQESVFELSYNPTEGYDWGSFPWDWRPESNIHIQLMGPRADYYTKAPEDSLIGGWGFNTPREELFLEFVESGEIEGERYWATIMTEEQLIELGGNWTAPDAYDYEGFFQRKYGTYVTQSQSGVTELNYGTNWRLIRYADVLLMAAEANFRAGDEAQALLYLNMVRERSELEPVSATGEALFQAIVDERELELAFEGFRFIDLVRWGLAEEELGHLGFEAGKNELLPIPVLDVTAYGLEQNPGF
ncbi:RagB/SusD family nutrient uptake outer membrane protein [Nafulsella turpanensis]|uniref:RagB/SusD family nutrient uptake outer membrane protein n=1 Tax=Nafulsella turpanensis TaxID=1265690 RepID=UPI000349121F|nr:RagB/SusD family nutrient uptake outer membrane protein [Nafulsella turpanensis]